MHPENSLFNIDIFPHQVQVLDNSGGVPPVLAVSLFSTVKVESLTSVVATPGRGGEGGLQGAGVNGETEHWPERTLTVEQLLCL